MPRRHPRRYFEFFLKKYQNFITFLAILVKSQTWKNIFFNLGILQRNAMLVRFKSDI